MGKALKVLKIEASGRRNGSTSRELTNELVAALADRYQGITVTSRDLADSIPHVDDAWIAANFTPAEERDASQRQAGQSPATQALASSSVAKGPAITEKPGGTAEWTNPTSPER